jgi:NAD-dependent dihydropyrimidine dehydrogenase PreA subunit
MHGPLREYFSNRRFVFIDADKCVGCALCLRCCPISGVLRESEDGQKIVVAARGLCAGCMKCFDRCPARAINLRTRQEAGWA